MDRVFLEFILYSLWIVSARNTPSTSRSKECGCFKVSVSIFHDASSTTNQHLPYIIMTKYILVSGGVVSGIGKGVIGGFPSPCTLNLNLKCDRYYSFVYRPIIENGRFEGHFYQNRSIYEH